MNLRVRAANAGAAIEILDAIFATKPRDEWLTVLRDGGDFIFTIINSVDCGRWKLVNIALTIRNPWPG